LEGRPITARPPGWTYLFGKLVSRNRVAAALAALLLLASGAGVWTALHARIDRAQLEGKEAEVERIVAMLNARGTRWVEPDHPVAVTEKVADVQTANRLMASDTVRALSIRAPDPVRVKRLIADLRRFLERADEISRDQPTLRKEIAVVYRQIGDFESTAPLRPVADVKQAAVSYQRAAPIAAAIRSTEPSWADSQLAELGGRLQQLGSPLELASAPTTGTSASTPAPDSPPPPAERKAAAI